MPFVPVFLEKVKACLAAVAGFFSALAGKTGRLGVKARVAAKRAAEASPEKKRRIAVFCAAGALGFLIIIAIMLVVNSGRDSRRDANSGISIPSWRTIPPEDFFLPEEPDFVPGVLPEREQRESWTLEDAQPYWQDPLKYGEEKWRDMVEAAIDKYLESVP
ncbi:MAG: hypothetical protein FWG99_06580 [Treponema sp.]|nr:hypothetical protein [Treponema sp.]